MRLRLITVVVAGTIAAVPTTVRAQTGVDFTPHLGMYFPMNPVVQESSPQLQERQVTAVVLGGRLAIHASRRIIFETTMDYTPSPVAVTNTTKTVDNSGGMLFGSALAVARFGRAPEVRFGAGFGLVNRFGTAWRGRTGTTDPAFVTSIAARFPLTKWMPIKVRLEIENYTSRVQFGHPDGAPTTARLNHDTLWSLGFELPLSEPKLHD
jgi:hypothetical protein